MWIRPPMPVTTRIIVHESGSTQKAMFACSEPMSIQCETSSRRKRCSGSRPFSWKNAMREKTNASRTGVTASTLIASLPKRRWIFAPPRPFTAAPRSGSSGIQRRYETWVMSMPPLVPERVRRLDVDTVEVLVDAEDDREADRRLRGREHDDEDREHLAVDRGAAVARERDVVDVGGVQDELDAHQDADRVLARQHRVEPEGEDQEADDQEVLEADPFHPVSS